MTTRNTRLHKKSSKKKDTIQRFKTNNDKELQWQKGTLDDQKKVPKKRYKSFIWNIVITQHTGLAPRRLAEETEQVPLVANATLDLNASIAAEDAASPDMLLEVATP